MVREGKRVEVEYVLYIRALMHTWLQRKGTSNCSYNKIIDFRGIKSYHFNFQLKAKISDHISIMFITSK